MYLLEQHVDCFCKCDGSNGLSYCIHSSNALDMIWVFLSFGRTEYDVGTICCWSSESDLDAVCGCFFVSGVGEICSWSSEKDLVAICESVEICGWNSEYDLEAICESDKICDWDSQ